MHACRNHKINGDELSEGLRVICTVLNIYFPCLMDRVHESSTVLAGGLRLIDHRITVPLDYTGQIPGRLTIFVREAVLNTRSSTPSLLFLQGGPGHESPRPTESSGFLKKLGDEYRIFLMDQRGTGLSNPISSFVLKEVGADSKFDITSNSVQDLELCRKDTKVWRQLQYLKLFRADSIVRDAEMVRSALLGTDSKWSILGQSFGGFCCFTYLSMFPLSVQECFTTGGIPPVDSSPITVYRALCPRILSQMDKYYKHYPEDEELIRQIVLFIDAQPEKCVLLPSGSVLSVSGFQSLGNASLGFSGGFAKLHYLLERAFERGRQEIHLSYWFLSQVDMSIGFDRNPLYALLHESIYCQAGVASEWAAFRVVSEFPEFNAVEQAKSGRRVYFTGEMVFPWIFDNVYELRSMKGVAHALANYKGWKNLYSIEVLKHNQIPIASAVYYNDMYVDCDLSEKTALNVNKIKLWVTSSYTHGGLRDDPSRILDRLRWMIRDIEPHEI